MSDFRHITFHPKNIYFAFLFKTVFDDFHIIQVDRNDLFLDIKQQVCSNCYDNEVFHNSPYLYARLLLTFLEKCIKNHAFYQLQLSGARSMIRKKYTLVFGQAQSKNLSCYCLSKLEILFFSTSKNYFHDNKNSTVRNNLDCTLIFIRSDSTIVHQRAGKRY